LCLVLFSIIVDYDYDYDYDYDVCEFGGFRDGLLRICVCVWVCSLVVCIGREVVAFYLRHELGFQGGFSKLVSWVVLGKVWFLLLGARGWVSRTLSRLLPGCVARGLVSAA
jgi:hypothetical protein